MVVKMRMQFSLGHKCPGSSLINMVYRLVLTGRYRDQNWDRCYHHWSVALIILWPMLYVYLVIFIYFQNWCCYSWAETHLQLIIYSPDGVPWYTQSTCPGCHAEEKRGESSTTSINAKLWYQLRITEKDNTPDSSFQIRYDAHLVWCQSCKITVNNAHTV